MKNDNGLVTLQKITVSLILPFKHVCLFGHILHCLLLWTVDVHMSNLNLTNLIIKSRKMEEDIINPSTDTNQLRHNACTNTDHRVPFTVH